MEEYISKEQFSKLASQIHMELMTNKFDETKTADLKAKLTKLKHLRAKSIILETTEASKQKGL